MPNICFRIARQKVGADDNYHFLKLTNQKDNSRVNLDIYT
jgi:hypothetical protein